MQDFKTELDNCFGNSYDTVVFDKVVSLGGNCQVAEQLRRKGLRFDSFPFDWIFAKDIDCITKAFRNNFSDWLLLENLTELSGSLAKTRRVRDDCYGIVHQHIFPLSSSIEEAYPSVKAMTDRRTKRLLELGGSDKRILFIYSNFWATAPNVTEDKIIELGEVLREKFGKNAVLLVINHTREYKMRLSKKFSEHIYVCELYDENEGTGQNWRGYDPHWDALLGRIKVSDEIVDLGDDAIFKNFFRCETNKEKVKFRWSKSGSEIHLEKFEGGKVTLDVDSPVPLNLKVLNVYGETVLEKDISARQNIEIPINHTTRFIKLQCSKYWRPCDTSKSQDSRELGVRVQNVHFKR